MINWDDVTQETSENALKVIERVQTEGLDIPNDDYTGLLMDIEATSLVVDIDFHSWLNASRFDFVHDVVGIYSNLNRETGLLDNCFLPRFAK